MFVALCPRCAKCSALCEITSRDWHLFACVAQQPASISSPPFCFGHFWPNKTRGWNHVFHRRLNRQFTGPSYRIWHLIFFKLCLGERFSVTGFFNGRWISCFKKKFVSCQDVDDAVVQRNKMFRCTESPCSSFRCVLSDCGPLALTHSHAHSITSCLSHLAACGRDVSRRWNVHALLREPVAAKINK